MPFAGLLSDTLFTKIGFFGIALNGKRLPLRRRRFGLLRARRCIIGLGLFVWALQSDIMAPTVPKTAMFVRDVSNESDRFPRSLGTDE